MYIYILILIHLCHEASQQGYHHKIQPEWVMFLVPRISKLATVVPPGALWLRCPDFQGTQWSARATDFFSGTLGPSWFLQWTNHGNHEVNSHGAVMGHMGHMYSHLGSWILDYLDSLKVEHCHPLIPYLKNHLKIPGKKKEVDPQEGSIPKRSPESQKCWPNIPCFIIIFLLKLILAKSPILRHPKTIYNPH